MFRQSLLLVFSTIIALTCFSFQTFAQESDPKEIYLKEAPPVPAASVARRQKVQEKFDDDSIRLEREIAQLSDDTIINDGSYVEYYHGGQKFSEGAFDQGVLEGVWKYWHENGQLCKAITYRDGKPHGKVEVFRPDGTLEAIQNYNAGIRDGEWVGFHEDGETKKVQFTFENGMMSGDRFTYYESGQERQKAQFKDGLLHGTMIEWDESGNKVGEATFSEGAVQPQ
jgi:antitoxin component YwqK of YwqJK toxin-antitoxin module